MKKIKIVLTFCFFLPLLVQLLATDIKGNLGIQYQEYDYQTPLYFGLEDGEKKGFYGELELEKSYDKLVGFIKIEALKGEKEEIRDYLKLNEFFMGYEGDDYYLKAGRDVKFWGALELYNITNIYNKQNQDYDEFDKNKKLGTNGITFQYFIKDDTLSGIVSRVDEQDNFFVTYTGSRDIGSGFDFSIYLHTNENTNQFLTHNTLLFDDSLYKLELLFNNDSTNQYQVGAGIEHTLYGVFHTKKDLGLLLEYYKSDDISLTYQNDFFVGTRVTFNNIQSSEIIAGVIHDKDSSTNNYTLKFDTRVFENYKLKLEYLQMEDYLNRFGFSLGYYF